MSSDPHGPLVTDPRPTRCVRPVPHSLSLLKPSRAPHACLLKHWKGQIVSSLALVRHPHAHSLASSLALLHTCFSRLLASFPRFFPHALPCFLFSRACSLALPFWLACPLLARFSSRVLPLSLSFFFERTSPILFIYAVRLGGRRVLPSSPRRTCAPLR